MFRFSFFTLLLTLMQNAPCELYVHDDRNVEETASQHILPLSQQSFGNSIPIKKALESINPNQTVTFSVDSNIQHNTVTWHGGHDFMSILEAITTQNNLSFTHKNNVIHIFRKAQQDEVQTG